MLKNFKIITETLDRVQFTYSLMMNVFQKVVSSLAPFYTTECFIVVYFYVHENPDISDRAFYIIFFKGG